MIQYYDRNTGSLQGLVACQLLLHVILNLHHFRTSLAFIILLHADLPDNASTPNVTPNTWTNALLFEKNNNYEENNEWKTNKL